MGNLRVLAHSEFHISNFTLETQAGPPARPQVSPIVVADDLPRAVGTRSYDCRGDLAVASEQRYGTVVFGAGIPERPGGSSLRL